jgi:hypothetical protein
MMNSTSKGTDCKTPVLGKDKAPVAFTLRHTTTKGTNLPTPSQILEAKHQKKKKILFHHIFSRPFKYCPPVPVKYRLCYGKRTNVSFPSARVNVKEGLGHAQSEFYSTYNMTVYLRPR